MCLFEYIVIGNKSLGNCVGDNWVKRHVILDVKKGAELEHVCLVVAFAVGECRSGIEQVQLKLQQVVFADLAHLALGFCHFIKFLCVGQILPGNGNIFF